MVEMAAYNPDFEEEIYNMWEEKNFFCPKTDEGKENFCIVIPPPNVTGILHIGHALNETLQDILVRWKRMQGYNVLWLPGTDHAGIATQNVVERELNKEGISRFQIGKEEFIKKVWEWREKYGNRIIGQVKRLGASCDWSKMRFTMDEGLSRSVKEAFVKLYEEDLIYKGNYIVNWCPHCLTALSDLEVEYKEENGKLYYILYPFKNREGGLVVATTRPETMFGDTAVAVNPKDERYKRFIGEDVVLPIKKRVIPVIGDSYVDTSFGTGALKITPAHDANDFLVGKKHNLKEVNVIDEKGFMNEEAGVFAGMDRDACRKALVEKLHEKGYLVKVEDYNHAIGHCYRCNTPIEPKISEQWFLKMKLLAKKAIRVVKEGKINFIPENWENVYFEWMNNIRDWCISRQIWWGHRIPAYRCTDCGKYNVSIDKPEQCKWCGGKSLIQEEDVLDTWFSSALWPFSTLGWPEKTDSLKRFYPTSVLVTGFDIIFFWVARMIMMGLHFMDDVPFKDVYIHALVRDEHGQKMSKTKNNVINPMDTVRKSGADALRFTLTALAVQGRDIKLSEKRIEGYRYFMNKIWNAYKFIAINTEDYVFKGKPDSLDAASQWITSRFYRTADMVNKYLKDYKFSSAALCVYQFAWHEFCDFYIEMSKISLRKKTGRYSTQFVLLEVFEAVLRLLHPFVPFVTEYLWQKLPNKKGESIMVNSYPQKEDEYILPDVEKKMGVIIDFSKAVRNIRSENLIPPSKKLNVYFNVLDSKIGEVVKEYREYIGVLAGVSRVTISKETPKGACFSQPMMYGDVHVSMEGIVDKEKEISRLKKQLEKLDKTMQILNKKLSNREFLSKAPEDLVESKRKEYNDAILLYQKLQEQIERVESI
jgi:valyl-tRNA synthetase